MSVLDRLFRKRQEYTLIVMGPKFGPVGEEKLGAIADDVRSALNDRYGDLFQSTQPMICLEDGGIDISLVTNRITAEKGLEIASFGQKCFARHRP